MKFAVVVLGAPQASGACTSALQFSQAVIAEGHELIRVFFYEDGVLAASALAAPPQDEIDITQQWQRFSQEHKVELIACIASCLRRGIVNATEAERYEKSASNLADGFEISGLGQLIDATINADRVVTFGG